MNVRVWDPDRPDGVGAVVEVELWASRYRSWATGRWSGTETLYVVRVWAPDRPEGVGALVGTGLKKLGNSKMIKMKQHGDIEEVGQQEGGAIRGRGEGPRETQAAMQP